MAELRFSPEQTFYSSLTQYKAESGVHTASYVMGTAALSVGTRRLEREFITPTYYRRRKCFSCDPSSLMERGTEKAVVNRLSQLLLESKLECPKRSRHFTNRTTPALTKRMAPRCRSLLRELTDSRIFGQQRRQNVRDGNSSGA
jgi:hypothetical protein